LIFETEISLPKQQRRSH